MTTLIIDVINYDCDCILSNYDYNVYHTNVEVILHLYSLSYIYYANITSK